MMRIVFVNLNSRREGGIETYLDTVISALQQAGHEVSLCHEVDLPPEREPINLPPGAPAWCVAKLGIKNTLDAVRQWRPDVIYTHSPTNVKLERGLLNIAPAVFFAHAFYGTCISGSKSFKAPVARPCSRRFGWQCLLHYYPKRCGGLNPVTMLRLYRAQTNRLESLNQYRAVLTHSEFMQAEYISNGIPAERVFCIPYCVKRLESSDMQESLTVRKLRRDPGAPWRLVFVGRMDELKGGMLLLDALAIVRAATGWPLKLVFAGDRPARKAWEAAAGTLTRSSENILIEFPGWMPERRLQALFRASDLLVVPSVWPEPFGVVGVQAALEGVPAAAFAVGGIPKWLIDGVTGHLAPGDPPTAQGLSDAIVKCLGDDEHYFSLRSDAEKMANRFTVRAHVAELLRHLEGVAS